MVEKKEDYLNTQSELSMRGAGYYSKKTVGAKIAIDNSQHLIANSISKISNLAELSLLPLLNLSASISN